MKTLVQATLIAILAAGPALATPKPDPASRECIKLDNQIARYERDAGWARDRDNALWEKASLDQMERLAIRRQKRCPEYRQPNQTLARLADLAIKLGSLAARYFMMGM